MKYIISIVAFALILFAAYSRSKTKQLSSKCREAFDTTFETTRFNPQYELNWCYSYPFFTVTFKTKQECESAIREGLAQIFSEKIYSLCKDIGSKSNPFNTEQGIWFTSEEEKNATRKQDEELIKRQNQLTSH